MAESTSPQKPELNEYIEKVPKHDDHGLAGFITPDGALLVLTWVTFFITLFILTKYAWRPILNGLDRREEVLRKSLDNAEKIQAEMEALERTTKQKLAETEQAAKDILAESRKSAQDAAKIIEAKAKEETQILIENAQREIREQQDKAQSELKAESARIAVELAEKLIGENMSDKKNREFVDKLIKDL